MVYSLPLIEFFINMLSNCHSPLILGDLPVDGIIDPITHCFKLGEYNRLMELQGER